MALPNDQLSNEPSDSDTMDNYEQNNEISTSYNNNNLKHNYNCKGFYEYVDSDSLEKHKFMEHKNFVKLEEEQLNQQQHNLNTPFLVKDILNINQTNYYERNDIWKAQERERRPHEYMPELYHQSQTYCPPDYLNQMYPSVPVHSNVDPYWIQETYHDPKVEEYYNYNPYCHNLYHQNYEHYQDAVPHHITVEVPPKEDHMVRETVPLNTAANIDHKKSVKDINHIESSSYSAEPLDKLSLSPRKSLSK